MISEALEFAPFAAYRQYARLAPHRGSGTFRLGETTYSGFAEFLLPAGEQAIVAFHSASAQTSQDFGTDLVIEGTCEQGPFRVECPRCYVYGQIEDAPGQGGGWMLVRPINAPARIQYGSPRPATTAVVLLNNFDYRHGDAVTNAGGFTRIGTPLNIAVGDRRITFRHHPLHEQILPLVNAGILHAASLAEFTVEVRPGESEDEALAFGADVAALCTFASGVGVGVAMLDLRDQDGTVTRRVIPQPVTSRFRRSNVVEDWHLSAFFRTTYDEYVVMRKAHPAWQRLASHCGSLEDAPYLEQKFASLIMALEFFMRNCLIEKAQPEAWVAKLDFLELVGAVRKHLGWDIPKHYVARHTIRLLRNAVMHGGELPTRDSTEFRLLFDKWRLLLFRRVLMRLGYDGKVISPHNGWLSNSHVADFSEEQNSFTPADPETDPWGRFVKKLKEQRTRNHAEQAVKAEMAE
jgi:hypothetical protein